MYLSRGGAQMPRSLLESIGHPRHSCGLGCNSIEPMGDPFFLGVTAEDVVDMVKPQSIVRPNITKSHLSCLP